MTIRIPIIGQSTTTSFVPQQNVQAIQVADPRGEALQGLGKSMGEFADGLDKRDKAQQLKQRQALFDAEDTSDRDFGPAGNANNAAAIDSAASPYNPVAEKATEDNNAYALQSYAQCVKFGSDLTAHYAGISMPGDGTAPTADSAIATANAGAPGATLPANPADLLKTPNSIQAMVASFIGGGAGAGNPGASAPGMPGGSASAGAANDPNAPSPTDANVHGPTGAWVNGYDLGAQSAIAAAPSKAVADSLAAQCSADRLRGVRTMINYEAQSNIRQRQSTAISAVQTIATHGVAADPASLPEALAFIERHPIRIDGSAADQARFNAGLRQTVVGAAVQTLLARDPQGTLKQLQGGAVEAGGAGAEGAEGAAESANAAALHPAIAALTPEERAQYIPQARAAVYLAQGRAQADVAQRATAAVAPGGNPATPPSLPEFTAAYGAERGTQLHQEMSDKLSQGRQMKIFAALPSADIERARSDAQAGLHATARANADMLGTPAPASTGGRGESSNSAFALRAPQGDIADPHYAAQSRAAANTQSAAAAVLTARQQDPVKAGIDAGAFGLKAADMRTPQAVLASAASRGPVVGVLADTYNTGRVAFTNSEFADLGKTAAAMPAQERGPFFKQLADTLGDPDLVRTTLKRLGADNPVLAEAARMQYEEQAGQPGPVTSATGIISAPEQIYRGYTALNPTDGSEPQAMPPDTETRAAFTLGETDAQDPGAAETRYQTTRAIYASLAQQDKDKSGTFNPTRWAVAQRMATEGSGTAGEVGLGANPTSQYMGTLQSDNPTAVDFERPDAVGQAPGDVSAMGNPPGPASTEKRKRYSTDDALNAASVLAGISHINGPGGRKDDNANANTQLNEELNNLKDWTNLIDANPGERQRLLDSTSLKSEAERKQFEQLKSYLSPNKILSKDNIADAAESRRFVKFLETGDGGVAINDRVRAHLMASLSPEEISQFGDRIRTARDGKFSQDEVAQIALGRVHGAAKAAAESGLVGQAVEWAKGTFAARKESAPPPPPPPRFSFSKEEADRLKAWTRESTQDMPAEHQAAANRFSEKLMADPEAAMKEYAAIPGTDGGKILNTDLARHLSPDYARSKESQGELAAAVHAPASWFMDQLYQRKLSERPLPNQKAEVLITAGGSGSGKTSAIDEIGSLKRSKESSQLVVDTTLSSTSGAIQMIDQAIAAGKKVKIVYVNRDPANAFDGVLARAQEEGRSVPLSVVAKSHAGSSATILQLEKHYAGNPDVAISFVNNNGSKSQVELVDSKAIQPKTEQEITKDLNLRLDDAYRKGAISKKLYDQTKSH